MKYINVQQITGSPYDVDTVMNLIVFNRIPVCNINYGTIGEPETDIPMELFKITVNARIAADVFKRFTEKLQELMNGHIIEHIYVEAEYKAIGIYEGTTIDYMGII
mgnify:CR=1 FL=1